MTGAARGIGAAIARRLAADGAKVVINYLTSQQAAERLVSEIASEGGEAAAVPADIARPAAAEPLVAEAIRRYGHLDVLVNNAAVAKLARLDAIDETLFDWHFDANVKAAVFLTQAAARAFGTEGGAIVNISSLNTRYPSIGAPLYSATKAALEALTASFAHDLGPRGIRVNAVAPGQVDTDMLRANNSPEVRAAAIQKVALGRMGRGEDIAAVVAFLASNDAAWITGETLHVSGGQRL